MEFKKDLIDLEKFNVGFLR